MKAVFLCLPCSFWWFIPLQRAAPNLVSSDLGFHQKPKGRNHHWPDGPSAVRDSIRADVDGLPGWPPS